MPVMDGLQATRALRDDPRTATLPIYFVSAKPTPLVLEEAARAGGTGFIKKPFRRQEIIQMLDAHVNAFRERTSDEIPSKSTT